jgi:cytoskeleton protein RodZ
MDPIQNPLFKEPIGSLFRTKRQQLGLSIDDAARSLKYSAHLVQAIESEQWQSLGAPVFAKSYVNSYIKLLGLNPQVLEEIPSMSQAPALKSLTTVKVESSSKGSRWLLGLLTVLGLSAIVAYFGLRQKAPESVALDTLVSVPAVRSTGAVSAPAATASATGAALDTPPTGAVTAVPTPPALPATAEVLITAAQDCWVEVLGTDKAVLFKGILSPGQEVRQGLDKIGRITLGNASSAALSVNGTARDLNPIIKGSVARFSLDAEGEPVAVTASTNIPVTHE